MMEAPSTQGRGGDTLVKKNTVLVVGGTGTLGRQVRGCVLCMTLSPSPLSTMLAYFLDQAGSCQTLAMSCVGDPSC